MILSLLNKEITDKYIQENFRRISRVVNDQSMLKGHFKFVEITLNGAVSGERIKHNLGFIPKDVLQTSITGTGTITWNYDKFDVDFVDVTTTGPCVVRVFLGTYSEG